MRLLENESSAHSFSVNLVSIQHTLFASFLTIVKRASVNTGFEGTINKKSPKFIPVDRSSSHGSPTCPLNPLADTSVSACFNLFAETFMNVGRGEALLGLRPYSC